MPSSSRIRLSDKRRANPPKWQSQEDELDSVSNNGSCSGESEDQPGLTKERQVIPGMDASPDKQDKTRLRNERKHQRQKERKAKDLKERCAGYLMQRKLCQLSQTLVGMGFPADRATAALILNEGDVDKSVSTLLDYEHRNFPKVPATASLKVDISQELAGLAEIETRLGFPLPDVERAVVSCEGDVDAAVRLLREQQLHPNMPPQQQQQHQRMISDPRLMLRQPAIGAVPVPVPVPGWQRGPPPVMMHELQQQQQQQHFYSMNHHHHPGPALPDHPKFIEQQRERDIIADWRSSHPSQVMLNRVQRAVPLMKPQEPMFQQPVHHHHHLLQQQQQLQQHEQQQLYNQLMNPSAVPPAVPPGINWSSADTGGNWNVKAASSVDYQAIDWSVGLPRSPFVKPAAGVSVNGGRNMLRSSSGVNEGIQPQNGYRELDLSQEWTSPFAGKDLFHHQPVHSL